MVTMRCAECPIHVVRPDADCPVGRLGGWLSEAGAEWVEVNAFAGVPLPDPDAVSGVVVLGGHMSALSDDVAWIRPIKRLIESCVGLDVPLLGICLGYQLIAAACGGVVTRDTPPG